MAAADALDLDAVLVPAEDFFVVVADFLAAAATLLDEGLVAVLEAGFLDLVDAGFGTGDGDASGDGEVMAEDIADAITTRVVGYEKGC